MRCCGGCHTIHLPAVSGSSTHVNAYAQPKIIEKHLPCSQALQATYPEDGALRLTAAEKVAFYLAVALITTGEDAATTSAAALPPSEAQPIQDTVFQDDAADQEASQAGGAQEGARSQIAVKGAQTEEPLDTGTSELLPQLSGTLVLQDLSVSGQPVSLHFTLPANYPATEQPRLQIDCACDRCTPPHSQ